MLYGTFIYGPSILFILIYANESGLDIKAGLAHSAGEVQTMKMN